ncbi:MAG TPA: hypothetical protein VHD36_21055 [Pirellulales bacterium]|nr:hypothetical protein [Pirellulales bacterium]
MDCRRIFVAAGAGCLAFVIGCNSGDSAAPTTAASGGASPSAAAKPNEVVHTFLEAIRTGNDDLASQMLTEVARTETQKHELVVAPPGSDTAKFEVGEVEYVVKDELAHVASKWTDVGEDGQPHTDEIIWALRLDPQGWRIAGMATTIFPNEPPLLLDFEKPEEMMQQQQMAEAEMQRRAQGGKGPVPAAQTPPPAAQVQAPAAKVQTPAANATNPRLQGTQPPAQKAARPNDGNVLRQ